MAGNSKAAANAQFKKLQTLQAAGQASPQYETDARALRAKTARLRSLRSASETAELETGVKPTTEKAKRAL